MCLPPRVPRSPQGQCCTKYNLFKTTCCINQWSIVSWQKIKLFWVWIIFGRFLNNFLEINNLCIFAALKVFFMFIKNVWNFNLFVTNKKSCYKTHSFQWLNFLTNVVGCSMKTISILTNVLGCPIKTINMFYITYLFCYIFNIPINPLDLVSTMLTLQV